jgi:hypothetical protein
MITFKIQEVINLVIHKNEARLICHAKWKRDMITEEMICVQSDITKDEKMEEFNKEVLNLIVKCHTKYFGAGKFG